MINKKANERELLLSDNRMKQQQIQDDVGSVPDTDYVHKHKFMAYP